MKHGKRPTVRQCKLIKKWGLSCPNWLVVKDTTKVIVIVHRYSGDVREIRKDNEDAI